MPDPVVIDPTETEPQEPVEPTSQLEVDPDAPATPEGVEEEDPAEAPEEPEAPEELPEGVTKEGDQYVLALDGSKYKAPSLSALIVEMTKGMNEKQRVIREQKAKSAIKVPDNFDKNSEETQEENWADPDKIGRQLFSQARIDPAFAGYSEDDWATYKESKNLSDYQVTNLRTRVDAAQKAVETEVARHNIREANMVQVKQSEKAVQRMIAKAGLDPDTFGPIYAEILAEIWKDPQAKDKYGMISSADIVTRMFDRILPELTKSQTKVVEKKVRDEKLAAKAIARVVGGAGAGSGAKPKPNIKPVANLKDATAELRRRVAAGLI